MQILEYCTLLQACEWLAFSWMPLNQEDEILAGNRKRTYLSEPDLTNETAKKAFGGQLSRLKHAKKQLLILFNYGLKCELNNKKITLEKFPLSDDMDNLMFVGTPLYKSLYVLERPSLSVPEPDYNNDQGLYVKDKWYYDVKINFYELQTSYEKYMEIKQIEPHSFSLFISDGKLCCQKDNEPFIKLHTLSKGAKNTLILEYIISHPNRLITKQELIQNAGSVNFTTDDTISNTLQTLFEKLPKIKSAFFPIMSASEIFFRPSVTNQELFDNGISEPI